MNPVTSKRLNEPTGYVRQTNRVVSFFLLFITTSVFGDIALYHTLEIDLRDPKLIRVYAPIHAPELMLDKTTTDFSNIGKEWLDGLSEEDFTTLLERSEIFINDTIRLRHGPRNVNNGFPFSFKKSDDETAPGSLLATMEFPNPGGELRIELSPSSEKRLQVAMDLPKQFPKTRDLAAGESTVILLPENPSPPRNWKVWWLALLGIPLLLFAITRLILKEPTDLG